MPTAATQPFFTCSTSEPKTGEMAAKVLKGEATAAETPFEICEGGNVYVNTEAAGNIDFTISDDVLGEAAEVYETITVE